MNILFLTIGELNDIESRGIYTDLIRCFRNNGHSMYTASSLERRKGGRTKLLHQNGVYSLRIRTGNLTNCSMIEKGISTVFLERQFKRAICKYYNNVKFDLVIYSTPPITFAGIIKYLKKRHSAKSYLLLKDIFPQNAVDIGVLKTNGIRSVIYRYFRKKEIELYKVSDYIGCMSPANVNYIIRNNPYLQTDRIEVCPNSIEISDKLLSVEEKLKIRKKYGIPNDKTIFLYGGNLGKPQGIDFIIKCILYNEKRDNSFFLIVGDGTEYAKLKNIFVNENLRNSKLLQQLPKSEYDHLVFACDVGMIFLDYRFTVPNFPSRLLSYMEASLPVLAATDENTDIGDIIEKGGFGLQCKSNSLEDFNKAVEIMCTREKLEEFGHNSIEYLRNNYSIEKSYEIVIENTKR